jgi:hypothetical protein
MPLQPMFDDHAEICINFSMSCCCCVNVSDATSSQTRDDTRVQILELDSSLVAAANSLCSPLLTCDSHAAGNIEAALHSNALYNSTKHKCSAFSLGSQVRCCSVVHVRTSCHCTGSRRCFLICPPCGSLQDHLGRLGGSTHAAEHPWAVLPRSCHRVDLW